MEKTVSATGKYSEDAWSSVMPELVFINILSSCDVWWYINILRLPSRLGDHLRYAGSYSAPDLKVTTALLKVLMGALIFATILFTLTGGKWRCADQANWFFFVSIEEPVMVSPCKHRLVTRHFRNRSSIGFVWHASYGPCANVHKLEYVLYQECRCHISHL